MNRIVAFTLLAVSTVSWSLPAMAQGSQGMSAAEYARRSKKESKKAAKEYRKAVKKSMKEQRKQAKQANRGDSHRPPAIAPAPK